MKLCLQVAAFNYDGGPTQIAPTLARIADTAEQVGFDGLTVMDHLFQIRGIGPATDPMLEAYTTLGFLAGKTSTLKLGTIVTAAVYRAPALLIKAVTTLDVLSSGRAFLGVGAAWNEEESVALGLSFPPTAERFRKLEELLQIARQMWSDNDGPFEGSEYRLRATLNSPQSLQRPHPPIMVGGSGERKTLRLVAQYADACNISANAESGRKLDVLRQHCADVGRPYDEIEKTTILAFDPADPAAFTEQLRGLHELGFATAYVHVPQADDFSNYDTLAPVIAEAGSW
jgi:F420-dependent oxidoreductase-like protein